MSRIGKAPVALPKGVEAKIEGQKLTCKGPLGTLVLALGDGVAASIENGNVVVSRSSDEKSVRALHGTTRALIANAIEGVTKGYKKSLEVVGVGYKAQLQGKKVMLNVGFANTIVVAIPDGVKVEIPDVNHIHVSGTDKYLVGQTAAVLRGARPPEPYKGKGVRYADETVRRKAGKAAAGAAKK